MGGTSLEELRHRLRTFRSDRGWEDLHTPRNLAVSIAVEVGELLEHFQWSSVTAGSRVDQPSAFCAVEEELADVVIYAIQLADVLDIDLGSAVAAKIAANARKHPVPPSAP
jgi:dCTP diphosphatase